jgi:hypothetical protein
MNYYAVRSNSHGCKEHHASDKFCITCAGYGWSRAEQWVVVLLIKSRTHRFNGLYTFPGGNRYWVSNITWEEFDMLQAFGVEWRIGFDHDITLVVP